MNKSIEIDFYIKLRLKGTKGEAGKLPQNLAELPIGPPGIEIEILLNLKY